MIWPEVKTAQGYPRHYESNSGIDNMNLTAEKKFIAWIKDKNLQSWSVGCKIFRWSINTQVNQEAGN